MLGPIEQEHNPMGLWNTLDPVWQTCLTDAWRHTCAAPDRGFSLTAAAVTAGQGRVLATGTGHDLSDGAVQVLDGGGRPVPEHGGPSGQSSLFIFLA